MTISSTQNRTSYAGNGATTVFTFPYYFLSQSDLVVIEKDNATGVETTKTITTDYTVSGEGQQAGGSVTMLSAPASGKTLTILRDPEATQDLDLVENDPMPAEELEKRLDKGAMWTQRLKDQVERSVKLTEGYASAFDPSLPPLIEANRALIINPAGNGFVMGPSADEVENAQTYAINALNSQNAAAQSASNALTSENNAAQSASNALTSENNAAQSESNALASEQAAALSESNASTSEGNALTSENNAAQSESNALTSEQNAAQSESNALASEQAAALSESNALTYKNEAEAAVALITYPAREGMLLKRDPESPCLIKTAAQTLSIKAGTAIVVNNTFVDFLVDTAVVMPTLTGGTDYAVYICADGTVRASSNFSAPAGYTTTNSKKIGGFHYGLVGPTETVAGGSFATAGNGMIWAQGDVDKIKGINQFSIWDLKFRPKCADPRGMALVADGFWVDIYFCGTNHHTDGTSKYNSDVASGTVVPKVPAMFGGNGTSTYSNMTWWVANEIVKAYGKRLIRHEEFVAAAFGVTEAQSLGGASSTITNTGRQAGYTSKFGLEQASGHHWTWGADSAGNTGSAWQNQTGGRGQIYGTASSPNYVILGGTRVDTSNSGSRCSLWRDYPWNSVWYLGVRAACDHLKLV